MRIALRGADEAVVVEVGGAVVVVVSAGVVAPVVVVAVVVVVVVAVVVGVLVVVFVVVVAALVVGSGVVGGESASAAATSPIAKSSMVPRIAISLSGAMGRIIDACQCQARFGTRGVYACTSPANATAVAPSPVLATYQPASSPAS
jgi:hypothetical protein